MSEESGKRSGDGEPVESNATPFYTFRLRDLFGKEIGSTRT